MSENTLREGVYLPRGAYARYKGRVYKVAYQGASKATGDVITRLEFLDGSSSFWARSGEPVVQSSAPARTRRVRRPCGYPGCDGVGFCEECSP